MQLECHYRKLFGVTTRELHGPATATVVETRLPAPLLPWPTICAKYAQNLAVQWQQKLVPIKFMNFWKWNFLALRYPKNIWFIIISWDLVAFRYSIKKSLWLMLMKQLQKWIWNFLENINIYKSIENKRWAEKHKRYKLRITFDGESCLCDSVTS